MNRTLEQPHTNNLAGRFSAILAMSTAILSSACCWLPLLLLGAGTSTAGLAEFSAAYRIPLVVGTGLLLGAAFYFVYFRKPACAPDGTCPTTNSALQRWNKIMLWIATAFVALFSAFPNLANISGDASAPAASTMPVAATQQSHAPAQKVVKVFRIEGMTCESCTSHVRKAIKAVLRVEDVKVEYPSGRTEVTFDSSVNSDDVIQAVEKLGYKIEVVDK